MIQNPRRDLTVHGLAELPDVGELARMQQDSSIHRPMPALFWMAETWWDLAAESANLKDRLDDCEGQLQAEIDSITYPEDPTE